MPADRYMCRRPARAALAVVAMLCAAPGLADQWYAEPRLHLYGFYEDNVGLVTRDPVSSPGYIASASVRAGRRSEVTDINLSAEVVRRDYFDDSDRNTNDMHFDGQVVRKIERDRFVLDGAFDIDSTLTSEESTSGRVQVNKRRYRWFVAPGWERQVTERLAVNVGASYQDVRYEDGLESGFVDYTFATLGGGASYGLSERLQLIGRLSYDRYDAERDINTTDSYGALGGVGYAIDETWSVTALVGGRYAKADTIVGSNNSNGGIFDISTSKRFETGTLSAGISRSLQPSSSAGLLDTLAANVNWNQQIKPRWRGILALNAYRNERPSGDASGQDRDYVSITPRLRYEIDRDWAIDLGYRYRYQKYDNADGSADANAVFFTVVYAPKRERPELDLTR